MSHVVLHCAEFRSTEEARAAAAALTELKARYRRYEQGVALQSARPPYGDAAADNAVPPPLVNFADTYGFAWPLDCGFLLKGSSDGIEVLDVDRLVFFYAGGYELGGAALETFFAVLGAVAYATRCHLVLACDDASSRARELASFLDDEDFAGQFTVDPASDAELEHSLTVRDAHGSATLGFGYDGAASWAFVALLPQLSSEDPALERSALRAG